MANASEATGVLEIIAKCNEKNFMEFQESLKTYLGSGFYGASFDVEDVFDKNDDGTCSVSVDFIGCGRWVFSNNLKRFGLWASYDADMRGKDSGFEALNKMKGIGFKLVFEFVDHEPGMGILYTETSSVEHKANEPWTSTQYTEIKHEDIDYTVDNLVDYGIFNTYSLIEVAYVESLRDFIGKEADKFSDDDLKRYISDHRGEFLHDWQIPDVIDEINEMRKH